MFVIYGWLVIVFRFFKLDELHARFIFQKEIDKIRLGVYKNILLKI